jgi:methylenetetrahydrofolate reductase (NADPH)
MKLKELLDSRRFVVSCELHVPSGKDPEDISRDNSRLWDWVDVLRLKVESQDQPGNLLRKTCRALRERGFGLELEVRTRNPSRPEIGRTLINACKAGIENFLIFTQDYWIAGDSVQEMMHFHVDMGKFFSAADSLRQGCDVEGQPVDGEKDFLVGAGIAPRVDGHSASAQLREMEQLAERGIGYFVTNPVFDTDRFEKFMNKAGTLHVPVIAEVVMLGSASEASLLNSMSWITVPQRLIERLEKTRFHREESLAIAFETVGRLRELCAGIHMLSYGDVADIEPVVRSVAR